MDNVYEVFTTPRETTGLQGIHFRFMPDMTQVKHALQVISKECAVCSVFGWWCLMSVGCLCVRRRCSLVGRQCVWVRPERGGVRGQGHRRGIEGRAESVRPSRCYAMTQSENAHMLLSLLLLLF